MIKGNLVVQNYEKLVFEEIKNLLFTLAIESARAFFQLHINQLCVFSVITAIKVNVFFLETEHFLLICFNIVLTIMVSRHKFGLRLVFFQTEFSS